MRGQVSILYAAPMPIWCVWCSLPLLCDRKSPHFLFHAIPRCRSVLQRLLLFHSGWFAFYFLATAATRIFFLPMDWNDGRCRKYESRSVVKKCLIPILLIKRRKSKIFNHIFSYQICSFPAFWFYNLSNNIWTKCSFAYSLSIRISSCHSPSFSRRV